jgi:hypothetical protein
VFSYCQTTVTCGVGNLPGTVAVRDSKDPAGPVLLTGRPQWRAFLTTITNS